MRECPFCHRLFASQLISKEQADSSELAKIADFPDMRWVTGGRRLSPWTFHGVGTGPRPEEAAPRPEALIAYKVTYKCKDCGAEWTRVSVEATAIPRSYVESEEEKTEYDAEKEMEEAREEEYAR